MLDEQSIKNLTFLHGVASKKDPLVAQQRQEGESYRSIKEQTGLALATITRIIKEQEAVA